MLLQRVVFEEETWDVEVFVYKVAVGVGVGVGPKPQEHAPCTGPGRVNLGPYLPWRGRVESRGAKQRSKTHKTKLLHSRFSIKSRIHAAGSNS